MTNAVTGHPAPRAQSWLLVVAFAGVFLGCLTACSGGSGGAPTACGPSMNKIVCENRLPGSPEAPAGWGGSADSTIVGFATQISVNHGETVKFKVSTAAPAYRIDIYRMGWYQGKGARKVVSITPNVTPPQVQPPCLSDPTTRLLDCGNWSVSASWTTPSVAVSGVYIARLRRTDTGGASTVFFVVRDDEDASQILFQTNDETWQAYNPYGGNSLYGGPGGRAYKVSYNRPFINGNVFFSDQYPMIRFLERNGYDVSYFSGLDADQRGAAIREHKVYLPNGHDEYWSKQQRANVEAARDAGVNLAFFSGNEVFWKTRWEPSIDGSATANRTLVCYKETHANAKIDPSPEWTGTWRDPRFSPPADGGRPENALTGTLYRVNSPSTDAIHVPAADGALRFWRNTSIASLPPSGVATLPRGTLGSEWDEVPDDPSRPPGSFSLSTTTVNITNGRYLLDYGSTYGNGTATHHLTMHRAPSGALVFGAGTIQWSWGLDPGGRRTTPDVRMQQATVNLLADMGTQPTTLMTGLVAASASTDTTPPAATITTPAAGARVAVGTTIVISGTATDTGGGVVAGVEVSTDNGHTWHPAVGRDSWTYQWTQRVAGRVTILARSVDDSANLQPVPASVTVNANPS